MTSGEMVSTSPDYAAWYAHIPKSGVPLVGRHTMRVIR
jgi:hypothetical protein